MGGGSLRKSGAATTPGFSAGASSPHHTQRGPHVRVAPQATFLTGTCSTKRVRELFLRVQLMRVWLEAPAVFNLDRMRGIPVSLWTSAFDSLFGHPKC